MRNLANYEKAAKCTPSDRISVIHGKKERIFDIGVVLDYRLSYKAA